MTLGCSDLSRMPDSRTVGGHAWHHHRGFVSEGGDGRSRVCESGGFSWEPLIAGCSRGWASWMHSLGGHAAWMEAGVLTPSPAPGPRLQPPFQL